MKNKSALVRTLSEIIAGISILFGYFIGMAVYLFSDNIIAAIVIGGSSSFSVDLLLIMNKRLFLLLPTVLLKIPFFRTMLYKAVKDDAEQ